ncbi:hypothetical protein Ahy_A05g023011 [Arachis hypogaea]|uniref:GRF-type domain-containing protein n=1 Tax=Arachis hypogaea TaxID=3818 RepID=A0A445D269_ARAHY|nr:hypothetical protein Ahy_A05g023011 [Arachis hypogaea]
MIGCRSQGQGSSTRSTTRSRSRTRPSRVPERCGCGCRPVLRWSGTNTNLDKSFFGCPNYNTKGKTWCEFFLWADDVEEEEKQKGRVDATVVDNEQVIVNLGWRIGKLEAEVLLLVGNFSGLDGAGAVDPAISYSRIIAQHISPENNKNIFCYVVTSRNVLPVILHSLVVISQSPQQEVYQRVQQQYEVEG